MTKTCQSCRSRKIGSHIRSDKRSRGIDHHDIAGWSGFAFQDALDQRAFSVGVPPRMDSSGARVTPNSPASP